MTDSSDIIGQIGEKIRFLENNHNELIEKIKKDIVEFENQREKYENEQSEIKQQLESSTTELAEKQRMVGQLQVIVDSLKGSSSDTDKIDELMNRLRDDCNDKLANVIQQYETTYKNIYSQFGYESSDNSNEIYFNSSVDASKDTITLPKLSVDNVDNIDSLVKQYEESLRTLISTEMNSSKETGEPTHVGRTEEEFNDLVEKEKNARNELENQVGVNSALKGEINESNEQLRIKKEELDSLLEKEKEAREELNKQMEMNNTLTEQIGNITKSMEKIEKGITDDELRNEINAIKEANSTIIEQLKQERENMMNELSVLREKNNALEQAKNECEAHIEDLRSKLDASSEFQTQIDEYRTKQKELEQTIDNQNNTITELQETLKKQNISGSVEEEVRRQIQEKEEQINQILEKQKNELDELTRKHSEAMEELTQKQIEVDMNSIQYIAVSEGTEEEISGGRLPSKKRPKKSARKTAKSKKARSHKKRKTPSKRRSSRKTPKRMGGVSRRNRYRTVRIRRS